MYFEFASLAPAPSAILTLPRSVPARNGRRRVPALPARVLGGRHPGCVHAVPGKLDDDRDGRHLVHRWAPVHCGMYVLPLLFPRSSR